ncbi:hypothetical protein IQ215_07275 [Cyanobacterium stanieri LEGE 03274]|uniref:Uncharacterized protein n=1 Tax=Cyanobacterium stanieri LEGE 03274 TaxID=1828756 RepID=A0ABR9V3N8_9CHRO|nr:hypothetical protein [Cyanobacterium stanieri]MBE9222497.1 hypothetical protein [Cyanobacterium stanieri LEGE 03274]
MASSSRKNSPDYLKSRMGTFLNPLFLSAIVGLGVIGIIAWQLIVINNQFRQSSLENSPPSRTGATLELGDNASNTQTPTNSENPSPSATNNGSPSQNPVGDPNSVELDIAEVDLLSSQETVQTDGLDTPEQSRLYNQVLSLPRVSPEIRPSGGNGNTGFAPNQGLLSPEFNQQRQSQIPVAPSPLNQAVNNVMSNYNPNSNIYRSQAPQNNIPSAGGNQTYYSPSLQNNYNVSNNVVGNPSSFIPTPQGTYINPNQTSTSIQNNRPSRTSQSPF